jgi:hypothetical protein
VLPHLEFPPVPKDCPPCHIDLQAPLSVRLTFDKSIISISDYALDTDIAIRFVASYFLLNRPAKKSQKISRIASIIASQSKIHSHML